MSYTHSDILNQSIEGMEEQKSHIEYNEFTVEGIVDETTGEAKTQELNFKRIAPGRYIITNNPYIKTY